jgi:hypothetical protein
MAAARGRMKRGGAFRGKRATNGSGPGREHFRCLHLLATVSMQFRCRHLLNRRDGVNNLFLIWCGDRAPQASSEKGFYNEAAAGRRFADMLGSGGIAARFKAAQVDLRPIIRRRQGVLESTKRGIVKRSAACGAGDAL